MKELVSRSFTYTSVHVSYTDGRQEIMTDVSLCQIVTKRSTVHQSSGTDYLSCSDFSEVTELDPRNSLSHHDPSSNIVQPIPDSRIVNANPYTKHVR